MTEIWADIPGYEGQYQVSDLGQVRSPRGVLAQNAHRLGYRWVRLRGKCVYVHRAVAMAFLPNPGALPEVDHIDGRKWHNDMCNLRWVSRLDNMRFAAAAGVLTQPDNAGGKNGMAILDEAAARAVRHASGTHAAIAASFGISRRLVGMIKSGQRWGHLA